MGAAGLRARALNSQGITTIALPWATMGSYLLLGAVTGILAAVLPAIRAARINILQAITYE